MSVKNYINNSESLAVFRYLDYPKFLHLITSKSLTFVKPSLFEDREECNLPDFTKLKEEIENFLKNPRTQRIEQLFESFKKQLDDKPINDEPENAFMYIFALLYNMAMYYCQKITPDTGELIREFSQKLTEAYVNNEDKKIKEILLEIDENDAFIDRDVEKFYKNNMFVSCWHIASEESDAMWKIYANKYGIAIKTTTEKLEKMLDFSNIEANGYQVIMNKIDYTDKAKLYAKLNSKTSKELSLSEQEFLNLFFKKNNYYDYEKELRILFYKKIPNIIMNFENSNLSSQDKRQEIDSINKNYVCDIKINSNIEEFIDEIILSPFAPKYYLNTLLDLFDKIGMSNLKEKTHLSKMSVNK